MSKSQILEIKDYSNVNVFKSAAVYPVVYRLKKTSEKKDVIMDVMDDMTSTRTHNIISSSKFYNDIDWDKYFNASNDALALIDKISEFEISVSNEYPIFPSVSLAVIAISLKGC